MNIDQDLNQIDEATTSLASNGVTPEMLHTFTIMSIIFIIILIISLILKGFALWYSARNNQKWWFLSLLIVNTLGILEVIYLIFFRNKKVPEKKLNNITVTKTTETV